MSTHNKNHDKAWEYFVSIGMIPEETLHFDYVLHHKDETLKDTDLDRYNEWRIEDLVPMTWSLHMSHHGKLRIGEKNNQYGRQRSEEHKLKISQANSGENHPRYGKKKSQEEIDKRTSTVLLNGTFKGEHNPMYGKHHSDETKLKMSELKKGLYHDYKWINDGSICKRVKYDDLHTYLENGWSVGRIIN